MLKGQGQGSKSAKTAPRRKSHAKREFTENELKDLRTAFDLLDRNQDGNITTSEMQFMFRKLGIELKDETVQDLIKAASHTGNSLLNEAEFLQWVKKIHNLLPEVVEDDISKDLIAAFKVFDSDKNGYITRDELRAAMEIMGEHVTERQLTEFINIADTDKDGKINYEEFARLLL